MPYDWTYEREEREAIMAEHLTPRPVTSSTVLIVPPEIAERARKFTDERRRAVEKAEFLERMRREHLRAKEREARVS